MAGPFLSDADIALATGCLDWNKNSKFYPKLSYNSCEWVYGTYILLTCEFLHTKINLGI